VSSLAQACARLGERDEALRYRQRFAELKKSDEAADRARTRSYDDLDRQRDMAVKMHNAAAQLHLQAGHAQQAEAHWLRAAAIDPGSTRPRETLAALYHQQNRFAAAVEMLRQLAELDPEGGRHETEAARCLIQIGQWDEARRMLQQVLQHAPEAAPAHLLLASTLLREGQSLSAAEQHARRAWELSGSAQALLVLAAVLQEAGDLPQARQVLRQAVDADPSDEQLRRAYEQLLPEN
jgi:tetratricopeptide (TPR) repeat protein